MGHLPSEGFIRSCLLCKQPVHSVYGGKQTKRVNKTFLRPYRNTDLSCFVVCRKAKHPTHLAWDTRFDMHPRKFLKFSTRKHLERVGKN